MRPLNRKRGPETSKKNQKKEYKPKRAYQGQKKRFKKLKEKVLNFW
jgi:hypothetical protein